MNLIDKDINQFRQGDCLITRIEKLPDGLIPVNAEKGKFVAAHSETGHNHVIEAKPGVEFFSSKDPLVSYLRVVDEVETTLEHLRSFDTHEPYLIKGGIYEIRRQRERTPDGWRRVED